MNCDLFYSVCPVMHNKFLFISTYSGFILCLFRYKSGAKPFIPILTVTQYNTMICFCRYLNYTGTVIGEVIEHLLFLRGEVEKYAKIGTGTNA
jgi:hypothetical protein